MCKLRRYSRTYFPGSAARSIGVTTMSNQLDARGTRPSVGTYLLFVVSTYIEIPLLVLVMLMSVWPILSFHGRPTFGLGDLACLRRLLML